MKSKIIKWLIPIALLLIIADIVTKYLVKTHISYGELIPVINNFFSLTYILNPGAAFGFLGGLDESYRQIFFVSVTIIAIIGILYIMYQEKHKLPSFAYTLILAGAIGNFIDRVTTGYVVDFLHFYIGKYEYPSFNIADICITTGVILLLYDGIFLHKASKDKNNIV